MTNLYIEIYNYISIISCDVRMIFLKLFFLNKY